MTVYVDDARIPFGRYLMCHMWADTREELFAMVDRIGVQRKWFQRPRATNVAGMDASWEHFDIVQAKRALAITAGAIATDRFGPIEHVAKLRGDHKRIEQIAASRVLRAEGNLQ